MLLPSIWGSTGCANSDKHAPCVEALPRGYAGVAECEFQHHTGAVSLEGESPHPEGAKTVTNIYHM